MKQTEASLIAELGRIDAHEHVLTRTIASLTDALDSMPDNMPTCRKRLEQGLSMLTEAMRANDLHRATAHKLYKQLARDGERP